MGCSTMLSPNRGQAPRVARQGSLYNHNLAESQNHLGDLGKRYYAMNVEDIMHTMVAENQHQNHATSSPSSINSVPNEEGNGSVPPWPGFLRQEEDHDGDQGKLGDKATLYLDRTGVIDYGDHPEVARVLMEVAAEPVMEQQTEWLQQQLEAAQRQQQQSQSMPVFPSGLPVYGNVMSNVSYTENHQMRFPVIPVSALGMPRPDSLESQTTVTTEVKRLDEVTDKTFERKQKRMIKNRESAARSRAKKQAYINELEQKVRQLTEANESLRKKKKLEMLIPLDSIPVSGKYLLRRTRSGPL